MRQERRRDAARWIVGLALLAGVFGVGCNRGRLPPGDELQPTQLIDGVIVGPSEYGHLFDTLTVLDARMSRGRAEVRHVPISGSERLQRVAVCQGQLFGLTSSAQGAFVSRIDLETLALTDPVRVPFERRYCGALVANDESIFFGSDTGLHRIDPVTGDVTCLWSGPLRTDSHPACGPDVVAFITADLRLLVVDSRTGESRLERGGFTGVPHISGMAGGYVLVGEYVERERRHDVIAVSETATDELGTQIRRIIHRADPRSPVLVEMDGRAMLVAPYDVPPVKMLVDVATGKYAFIRTTAIAYTPMMISNRLADTIIEAAERRWGEGADAGADERGDDD